MTLSSQRPTVRPRNLPDILPLPIASGNGDFRDAPFWPMLSPDCRNRDCPTNLGNAGFGPASTSPAARTRHRADLDRSWPSQTRSRSARDPHLCKACWRPRAQLAPPTIQLARVHPGLPRNRRNAGAWLQRRRNQLLLLHRRPATPTLDRRDHLNPRFRHVNIPVNTHMTHSLTRSTRRPLPDGYTSPGPDPLSARPWGLQRMLTNNRIY